MLGQWVHASIVMGVGCRPEECITLYEELKSENGEKRNRL